MDRVKGVGDMHRRRDERGARSGQGLVELAFALPILLLMLLGTIDLGRLFFDYVEMRNAVREGAGYGAHVPSDTAGIVNRVYGHGIPDVTSVTVVCEGTCISTAGQLAGTGTIVVTAERQFRPVTLDFLHRWFGFNPITLRTSASMRVLQ
jgi:Flp pilus assembly protein TadG